MPGNQVALMQQLHAEHAVALRGYCVRLAGQDHAAQRTSPRRPCSVPGGHISMLDESHGSVRAWLFTVARNIVIDDRRTKRFHAEFAVAEVPEAREAGDHTDELLLSWVVAEAVRQLSPEHRAVLLECYYGAPQSRRPRGAWESQRAR